MGRLKSIFMTFTIPCYSFQVQPYLLHKADVLFNPRQKAMRALSPVDQRTVLATREFTTPSPRTGFPPSFPSSPCLPSAEKLSLMMCDSEIQRYQNYSVVPGSCKTILGWWKEHAQEFPQLAHIAKTILCIMATSAPSKRSFSVAGHVVLERCPCLSGSSVSDILLINSASE